MYYFQRNIVILKKCDKSSGVKSLIRTIHNRGVYMHFRKETVDHQI